MLPMTSLKKPSDKWTPTTRRGSLAISISAIVLSGACTRQMEVVWVDLDRVALEREVRTGFVIAPAGEFSLPVGRATIPGIEPSMRGREAAEDRRSVSRELMAKQFEKLQLELEENYRRVALSDARAEIAALRRAFSSDVRSRTDAAMEEISLLVQSNAPVRARMIVRAALLVGWPRIRGYSERELSRSSLLRDWDREGRELHARIAENEKQLDDVIARILRSVNDLNEQQAASIEAEVRSILRRADRLAARMTTERLEETKRADLPPLLESDYVASEPQAALSATLPGVQARMHASNFRMGGAGPTTLAAFLNEKLHIFLGVHGYKLGGPTSTDKTAEFLVWLKHP